MPLFHKSPSQPPKPGTPSHGLAQTPHGITATGFGHIQSHLTFPALILITPLDEEDAASDFVPATHADLVAAQKDGAWRAEGIPQATPLPRVGGISRGWWVRKGVLMKGFGRVVRVLEDVSVAWVDGSGGEGTSKEEIEEEIDELWR
ncbi:hypothetical protein ASPCAL11876 [Aspergillus calidoustus]|uniref:Uncharacterized protein n=1 Tax=Aspergillus calidoustus TaxID=454130 RepID=A0A0U5GAM8_ASPCI|nr:hypothetical protein ASPCAL11876 [Aspergillus calidoustus]